MKKSELRKIIKEELSAELSIKEGMAGGIIGYLVGALVDFLLKKKPKSIAGKSAAELEKDLKAKLDKKYNSDPKFKKLVDDIASGKIVSP
jgi:hypothetical protein